MTAKLKSHYDRLQKKQAKAYHRKKSLYLSIFKFNETLHVLKEKFNNTILVMLWYPNYSKQSNILNFNFYHLKKKKIQFTNLLTFHFLAFLLTLAVLNVLISDDV